MKPLLFGLLLLCIFPACAKDTINLTIDARQRQFSIKLPSNPTTGYQWKLKNYDKTLFKLVSTHYIVPATKRIGAGGKMSFLFVLLKGKKYPHTTEMAFTYLRSWEPKSGMEKQVNIHFTDTP